MAEFAAITLTNMYRSEGGAARLRWDHLPYCHRARVDRSTERRRAQRHPRVIAEQQMLLELVRTWFGFDDGLLEQVRTLPLLHNPFRFYLRPRPSRVPHSASRFPGSGPCP